MVTVLLAFAMLPSLSYGQSTCYGSFLPHFTRCSGFEQAGYTCGGSERMCAVSLCVGDCGVCAVEYPGAQRLGNLCCDRVTGPLGNQTCEGPKTGIPLPCTTGNPACVAEGNDQCQVGSLSLNFQGTLFSAQACHFQNPGPVDALDLSKVGPGNDMLILYAVDFEELRVASMKSLPSSVKALWIMFAGKPATIMAGAFELLSSLEFLVLGGQIKLIEAGAFRSLPSLIYVKMDPNDGPYPMPTSIQYLHSGAFDGCDCPGLNYVGQQMGPTLSSCDQFGASLQSSALIPQQQVAMCACDEAEAAARGLVCTAGLPVACGPGTGAAGAAGGNSSRGGCYVCPRGFYSAREANAECMPCPAGLTTRGEGTTTAGDCEQSSRSDFGGKAAAGGGGGAAAETVLVLAAAVYCLGTFGLAGYAKLVQRRSKRRKGGGGGRRQWQQWGQNGGGGEQRRQLGIIPGGR